MVPCPRTAQCLLVNGVTRRQPDGMGCLDPIRHKSHRKIAQKDPSFRGILSFNPGEGTFLIRKGSPLYIVWLRLEFAARAKWGICNAGASLRSAIYSDLLNLTPGQPQCRARRSNCRCR